MTAVNPVEFDTEVGTIHLPQPPEVLRRAHASLGQGDADVGSVVRTLVIDAGLTAPVLTTVNSSIYAPSRRIGSVQDAIRLLGLRTVVTIVTCTALRQTIRELANARPHRYWEGSVRTAVASGLLARTLNIGAPEEAYIAGLFLDCGIPVLAERYPGYLELLRVTNAGSSPSLEAEDRQFGTNHVEVGYSLARAWQLPPVVAATLRHHHQWQDAVRTNEPGNRRLLQLLAVTKVAEHVETVAAMRNGGIDPEWERAKPFVMQHLQVSEFDLVSLRDQTINSLPPI